jgi:hypothetical protein
MRDSFIKMQGVIVGAMVSVLSACSSFNSSENDLSTNKDVRRLETSKNYVATILVRNGNVSRSTEACGEKIKQIEKVKDIEKLPAIGLVTFSTSSELALQQIRGMTDCVVSVEEAGEIDIGDGNLGSPSTYIAVVIERDGNITASTDACVVKIKQIENIRVQNVLSGLGIISFSTSSEAVANSVIDLTGCVSIIEKEGDAGI